MANRCFGVIPSDDALLKLFYLAISNISKKWTMPIRDWKAALNRFNIQFDDRMPQQSDFPFTQNSGHPRCSCLRQHCLQLRQAGITLLTLSHGIGILTRMTYVFIGYFSNKARRFATDQLAAAFAAFAIT